MTLTWKQSFEAIGPHSEVCVRFDCVEHPRLFALSQKSGFDSPWVQLFYVEGISAQHWSTAAEAVAAMEANPA